MRRATDGAQSTAKYLSVFLLGWTVYATFSPACASGNYQANLTQNIDYNSNVFLLSKDWDPVVVLGDSHRGDFISTTGVSALGALASQQQRVTAQGSFNAVKYRRFERLDYTGGKAEVEWNGKLSSYMSGELGYDYSRNLTNFQDVAALTKDIIDNERQHTALQFFPAGELQSYIGLDRYAARHSADTRKTLDNRSIYVTSRVFFRSPAANVVGLEAVAGRATYKNLPVNVVSRLDNRFTDISVAPYVSWTLSGASSLFLRTQYTRRKYDTVRTLDFSGLTGNANFTWSPGEKFSVIVNAWRQLNTSEIAVERTVIGQGVTLTPTWQVTSALVLQPMASWEKREYKGEFVVDSTRRADMAARMGMQMTYQRQYLFFRLAYQRNLRKSNSHYKDYDANTLTLAVGVNGSY